MRSDLHLHTTCSDGRLTPAEVVDLAVKRGLDVIAITDHDSVEGIAPALTAAQSFPFLKVIPGVEISTDFPDGEIHVLGYFMDCADPELRGTLKRLRRSRRERAHKMIAELDKLGVHIEWQQVKELAGAGAIGRLHIAQALLERGHVSSVQQAFTRYIGRDCAAYVERGKLTPVEAVEMVVNSHGLPVLAHPRVVGKLEVLLPQLQRAGLVGIEVYCSGYAPELVLHLLTLADEYGLIPCGGSDYHGLGTSHETLPGDVEIPTEFLERLLALAESRLITV
ncbi:PHP domain-containing protein [Chloroflexota bacterium]